MWVVEEVQGGGGFGFEEGGLGDGVEGGVEGGHDLGV